MLNLFQKNKLKIKTKSFKKFEKFEKIKVKPNIITTFEHLCPGSRLKRSHKAIMSLCPIHGENNPSFAMYEETNTYFCFSCKASGDSYRLIMEIEGLDFKEAIEYAKRNGLYD